MGSRHRYAAYFPDHPGVYYRSPGWVEFQTPDLKLEPAFPSQKSSFGEQTTLEEFIAKYGDENGRFLYDQFSAFRRHYSGLTYISTGIASDEACRTRRAPKQRKSAGHSKTSPARFRSLNSSSAARGTPQISSSFRPARYPSHARRRRRGRRMTRDPPQIFEFLESKSRPHSS